MSRSVLWILPCLALLASPLCARTLPGVPPGGDQVGLSPAIVERDVVSALGPPPLRRATPSTRPVPSRPVAEAPGPDAPPFYVRQIGGRFVQLGLAYGDDALRVAGWQQLRLGFANQRPDGGFDAPRGALLGTAFLVSSAAAAILLDRLMGKTDGEDLAEPVARAASWLAAQDPRTDRSLRAFRRYTHRYWITANALCLASATSGNSALRARARDYAALGVAAQRPNGVNPEGGGYDIGYQAAGLIHAAQYLRVCASGVEREAVERMLLRGLDWLGSRIGPDGAINSEGSTRILREPGRDGTPKRIPYRSIAGAFAWGRVATRQKALGEIAERIIQSRDFIQNVGPVEQLDEVD